MTGPDHYLAAESLTQAVTKPDAMNPQARVLLPGDHSDVLALAQVHATLAGVYAQNRATTELIGLVQLLIQELREAREATS